MSQLAQILTGAILASFTLVMTVLLYRAALAEPTNHRLARYLLGCSLFWTMLAIAMISLLRFVSHPPSTSAAAIIFGSIAAASWLAHLHVVVRRPRRRRLYRRQLAGFHPDGWGQ